MNQLSFTWVCKYLCGNELYGFVRQQQQCAVIMSPYQPLDNVVYFNQFPSQKTWENLKIRCGGLFHIPKGWRSSADSNFAAPPHPLLSPQSVTNTNRLKGPSSYPNLLTLAVYISSIIQPTILSCQHIHIMGQIITVDHPMTLIHRLYCSCSHCCHLCSCHTANEMGFPSLSLICHAYSGLSVAQSFSKESFSS